jgi:hypothetical protein
MALRTRLREMGCNVHLSNLKVVARKVGAVMYPDLFVRCGGLLQQEVSTEDPVVVFEVLSTSTAQRDLTRKKYAYQSIPSVAAIVYVSQREPWVDIVRRTEHGWADGYVEGMDAILELPEIGSPCRSRRSTRTWPSSRRPPKADSRSIQSPLPAQIPREACRACGVAGDQRPDIGVGQVEAGGILLAVPRRVIGGTAVVPGERHGVACPRRRLQPGIEGRKVGRRLSHR